MFPPDRREDGSHSSKQPFQQPKDRPQAEGWFTPTPRAPEISNDKGAEVANAFPLSRARPVTPGFYYELVPQLARGSGLRSMTTRSRERRATLIAALDMPNLKMNGRAETKRGCPPDSLVLLPTFNASNCREVC
jgi:hypothetical protein